MNKKVLGVDPGEKRIGIAVSDPSGTLARPLQVIQHVSRVENARRIVEIAEEQIVCCIIVGQPLDQDGEVGFQARKSRRLAEQIKDETQIPVKLWDESGSTKAAKQIHIRSGSTRKKRKGHLDEHAAAFILQSYLDAQLEREEAE